MDHWAWQHLSDWLEIRVEMRIGALLCVVDGPTEGRPWSPTAARATLRQLAVSAGVRRRFAPHLEANTMTSRPDEGERPRYAALMRELIALAEELRRGFGVVPFRRSIADISAQTLSVVPGRDHRRRLDHQ
jgi:hypothetical protein